MDETRMSMLLREIDPDGLDDGLAIAIARLVMRRHPGKRLVDSLFLTGPKMLGAILTEVSAHTESQTYRAATAILQPLGEEMYSRVRNEFDAVSNLINDIRNSARSDVVVHRRSPGPSGDLYLELAMKGYYITDRPLLHIEAKCEMNYRWITPMRCSILVLGGGPDIDCPVEGFSLEDCVIPVRKFWSDVYYWLVNRWELLISWHPAYIRA